MNIQKYNKAIVSLAGAVAAIATLLGYTLPEGFEENAIELATAVLALTSALVWAVPNKDAE